MDEDNERLGRLAMMDIVEGLFGTIMEGSMVTLFQNNRQEDKSQNVSTSVVSKKTEALVRRGCFW
jgi:hypothetical protein